MIIDGKLVQFPDGTQMDVTAWDLQTDNFCDANFYLPDGTVIHVIRNEQGELITAS